MHHPCRRSRLCQPRHHRARVGQEDGIGKERATGGRGQVRLHPRQGRGIHQIDRHAKLAPRGHVGLGPANGLVAVIDIERPAPLQQVRPANLGRKLGPERRCIGHQRCNGAGVGLRASRQRFAQETGQPRRQ
jgi:hypothetical protein